MCGGGGLNKKAKVYGRLVFTWRRSGQYGRQKSSSFYLSLPFIVVGEILQVVNLLWWLVEGIEDKITVSRGGGLPGTTSAYQLKITTSSMMRWDTKRKSRVGRLCSGVLQCPTGD